MKVLLDTSVLIAALLEDHLFHRQAAPWLECLQRQDVEGIMSAHSLAELYAAISRMPTTPRLSPADAISAIEDNVLPFVKVRALDGRSYAALIRRVAAAGLSGGVVYDAVHAEVARRAGVDLLVTLNPRDFERVWTGRPEQVVSPLDTPPP